MSNWIYENSLNSNKSVMNWPKYYNMGFYLSLSLKMVGITFMPMSLYFIVIIVFINYHFGHVHFMPITIHLYF
jgi:hypothetical protein